MPDTETENAPDQADILAANETLTAENARLQASVDESHGLLEGVRADLATVQGERDSAIAERDAARTEAEQVRADLAARDERISALETELNEAKAAAADFDKKLAAELAKHGVRANALPAAARDANLSWTERSLAAKG